MAERYRAEITRQHGLIRWHVAIYKDDQWFTSAWWTCIFYRSARRTARRWIRQRQQEALWRELRSIIDG